MWDLVSLLLSIVVVLFILNYLFEPQKLVKDILGFKASKSKIDHLEERVTTLEAMISKQENK